MKALRNILLTILVVAAVSCERRILEEPNFNTTIDVEVKIKDLKNVTCDIYNDSIPLQEIDPEVIRVMFFDLYKDKLVGESFISDMREENGETIISGKVEILPGDYRVMLYAFGTESTLISRYNSFENCQAYTNPLSEEMLMSLKMKGPVENQPIHYQPDHLLAGSIHHESIPWHHGNYVIKAEAASVVESYYLQVKVEGLQYVSSSRAVLTSMCKNVKLSTAEPDYTPVSLYIELQKSKDNGVPVVCTVFNTFGRIPDAENTLEVTFDLITIDGRTISKTFDISDLFESEACINHNWLLLDETIVVEAPENPNPGGGGGGGFNPTVSDWEYVYHEIVL